MFLPQGKAAGLAEVMEPTLLQLLAWNEMQKCFIYL